MCEIEAIAVDKEEIKQWSKEYSFLKLATDLTGETAQYAGFLASLVSEETGSWDVKQAVLGGHLVRLFKLLRHSIAQARDEQAEMLWVSIRLAAECIVNFRFILSNQREEVYTSFLHHSLQHEKRLLGNINTAIQCRNGVVLPIEERMTRSIDRTFANSEVRLDDLPKRRIRNWANKNVRERARSIGLEEAYLGVFSGPSLSVHGNWGDFLQHHLEVKAPGRFSPKFENSRARPHPFLSLPRLALPGLVEYSQNLGSMDDAPIIERIRGLLGRVELAEELHEAFLCGKQT